MSYLEKLPIYTFIPGTPDVPEKPPIAPFARRLFATPSPPGTKYQPFVASNGFTQLTKTGVTSGASYGPSLPYMTFITFPGIPTVGYGYPHPSLGEGPFVGHFDAPTPDQGLVRVTANYWRDGRYDSMKPRDIVYPPGYVGPTIEGMVKIDDFPGFPGAAAIPGTPDQTLTDLRIGWNAGANSITRLDGNVRTVFTMNTQTTGAVIGLTSEPRPASGARENIQYAFYFYMTTGGARFGIRDRGRELHIGAGTYTHEVTVFEIRRYQGTVFYVIDDEVVYVSPTPSTGSLCVGSCFYTAGDYIGETS